MFRTSSFLTTAILAVALSTAAIAQTPVTPAATKSAPAASAKDTSQPLSTQVETWTREQWEAAKKEWMKEKAKWADCRKQSDKQKLEGRKSWPFLYKCMTG